jgi:hypothetical protein
MFSSNYTRFFAAFALIFSLFPGCRPWPQTENSNSAATPAVAAELKSEIPFAAIEPARFQAEIIVTANAAERKTFVARDGANRRFDFNFGAKNHLTNLQTDKNYLLLPARKVYTESASTETAAATDEWADFLTTEWLSAKTEAKFDKLETTESLTKYRVRMGDGASGAEVFVYVDEKLGLPVRQEFYAVGEPKNLTYLFELKNLKLETDGGLFTVPADFRKVSAEEFGKFLSGEE